MPDSAWLRLTHHLRLASLSSFTPRHKIKSSSRPHSIHAPHHYLVGAGAVQYVGRVLVLGRLVVVLGRVAILGRGRGYVVVVVVVYHFDHARFHLDLLTYIELEQGAHAPDELLELLVVVERRAPVDVAVVEARRGRARDPLGLTRCCPT